MKNLVLMIGLALLVTAMPAYPQADNKSDKNAPKPSDQLKKKTDLYACWQNYKKDSPDKAFLIATRYLADFSDDRSKETEILREWSTDYQKTAGNETRPKETTAENSPEDMPTCLAEKSENAEIPDVAGTWEIVVTTRQGDLYFTLTLEQDGKNLGGAVHSPHGRGGSITGGSIEGRVIKLDLVSAEPAVKVKIEGTVDGDKMKGIATPSIPNVPELFFVGTRAK